jgi:hypothetical protein
MKRRFGFVSNSSSSSFVIRNSKLTLGQIDDIVRHSAVAEERSMDNIEWKEDSWNIIVTADYVSGTTMMDNFDMHTFLKNIGVTEDDIEWEAY